MKRTVLASVAFLVAGVLSAGGCGLQADPVVAAAQTAASPTGGRVAAAGQLSADWTAKKITFDAAINYAFDMLDSARNGTPMIQTGSVAKSADATAFAGAVLDAMSMVNTQIPKHDETILFWMRVGGLAYRAAEEAHNGNRLNEATNLVFAGPQHWQNEGYWYQHPNHDALAAVILAQNGRRSEAIARLQSRIELKDQAAVVYEMLMKGQ